IPPTRGTGPTAAIPPNDDDRNRLTGSQLRDAGGPRGAIGDFEKTIRILVHEDRWHPVLRCSKLTDLLVQLPRVGTAGATRRESQFARIDLPNRRAHS